MRNYIIAVFDESDCEVAQVPSQGNNAIEAFEYSCEMGDIYMNPGVKHTVVVMSERGLKIGFEAGQF